MYQNPWYDDHSTLGGQRVSQWPPACVIDWIAVEKTSSYNCLAIAGVTAREQQPSRSCNTGHDQRLVCWRPACPAGWLRSREDEERCAAAQHCPDICTVLCFYCPSGHTQGPCRRHERDGRTDEGCWHALLMLMGAMGMTELLVPPPHAEAGDL